MIYTEAEAKNRACPFGPLTVLAAGVCGEEPRDYPVWFRCQASDCMLWRWNKGRRENSVDDSPIECLELSVRATNALRSRGGNRPHPDVNTIGKLRALSEQDAMKRKNFGRKSWIEIQRTLNLLDAGEIPFTFKKQMDEKESAQIGFCGLAGKPGGAA